MSSIDVESRDVNQLIGSRVRVARSKAGLTQQELAAKLGTSHNKIHNIELGVTQARVSDLLDLASALDVSLWILLQDVIEPGDLRAFLWMLYADLASETGVVIDQMIASLQWVERRWRIKLRMPYQPVYHIHPERPPIEFVEAWENPMLTGGKKVLYVQEKENRLQGYFFESEIIPSNSFEYSDTPMMSGDEVWEDKWQLQQFLRENGYCFQLYPVRIHHDEYCSLEHRAAIEAQRRTQVDEG